MNILVVGNVLKDVYLNFSPHTEHMETDKNGTPWLDVGFDTSEHHFFSRNSSLGGAAISLEVLTKMGVECSIVGSDMKLGADGLESSLLPETYRYILIADGKISYLVPSKYRHTRFVRPDEKVDYVYVDRSAELDGKAVTEIKKYLDDTGAGLILYIRTLDGSHLDKLLPYASLVFLENNRGGSEQTHALASAGITESKIVRLSDTELSCQGFTEKIFLQRVDMATHLSTYSVAAATIIGGFALGRTVAETLALARANVEHARLNTSLGLSSMQEVALNTPAASSLELIAASLMRPGKGILAADESGGSIKKKFAKLNIPDTYENRRDYRNIFFTTPDIEKYLTGVILFDETAHQRADNGQTFVEYLTSRQIIPGIKVDQGLSNIGKSLETYTKGLDGLNDRLKTYYNEGLRFAKWRAAFEIRLSDTGEMLTPTDIAIEKNCADLAEYARLCQEAGLVPIVEPEVVYDGYYSLAENAATTGKILDNLFGQMKSAGINLRACLLKVNMVLAGKKYPQQPTPTEVGRATAEVLKAHVPAKLAGVVFLSGGQTPEQATDNLAAVVKQGPLPWPVTFSFARALQDPALYAWNGDNANAKQAKDAFLARLIANTDALKDGR